MENKMGNKLGNKFTGIESYEVFCCQDKYGVLDSKNKIRVLPVYDNIEKIEICEELQQEMGYCMGVFKGELDGKWKLITLFPNNAYVSKEYMGIGKAFGEYVEISEHAKGEKRKQGIVSLKGEEIVKPIYRSVTLFKESGFRLEDSTKKVGFMNLAGRVVVPCTCDKILDSPDENSIIVQKGGRTFIYSYTGGLRLGVDGLYSRVKDVDTLFPIVGNPNEYCIVNRLGENIFETTFSSVEVIDRGMLWKCTLDMKGKSTSRILSCVRDIYNFEDIKIKRINNRKYLIGYSKGECCIMDYHQTILLDGIDSTEDIFMLHTYLIYKDKKTGKYGIMNYDTWSPVTKKMYDKILNVRSYVYIVIGDENGYGLMDVDLNVIIPTIYQKVEVSDDGELLTLSEHKNLGLADENKNEINIMLF